MPLRKNRKVILNKELFDALHSIYTPKKEIFFFLIGEINEDKVIVHDAKYVLQESSFDSVYFKDLPSGFIGTFHTHPFDCKPSDQDLKIFNKLGGVHIIMGKDCIAAYDLFGNPLKLIIASNKTKIDKEKINNVKDEKEMKFHYVFIYTMILSAIILIILLIIFLIVWLFT